jgi:hypothetical protein
VRKNVTLLGSMCVCVRACARGLACGTYARLGTADTSALTSSPSTFDSHGMCCMWQVISGVGTRHYYRKLGYELDGPYMSKSLDDF